MSMSAQNPATAAEDLNIPSGRCKFDLLILLLVTAVVRGAVALVLPRDCNSIDLKDWRFVAILLFNGRNPYASNDYHLLNWPPFWMETLYFVMRFAVKCHLDFYACLRTVLVVADLGVLAALYKLLGLLQPGKRHLQLLLWGYCLNPLLTLLTVVHGNFDAFAAFWIILFLICLIRFRRGGNAMDWLAASACLGMGIFTKTFPLLLWPLLMPGARKMDNRARALAVLFVLGPVALSLGPVYMLSPIQVREGVINYHSMGAEFGLLSVLNLAHIPLGGLEWYGRSFSFVLLIGTLVLARILRKRDFREDGDVVLFSAMLLLSVFAVGPGYGAQYWFWVVPLFLACYGLYPGSFRIALWTCAIATIATNIFEYGIEQWLGGFLSVGLHNDRLLKLSMTLLHSPRLLSSIRLPMSLATLWLLVEGARLLVKQSTHSKQGDPS